ncbi:MAG: hypothetical protein HC831_05540 [Chloroflexia bacterium]|nr:hypothetical protein [Chloroflexia bacterium]
MEKAEIVPGRGVGEILLGMTQNQVENIIGKPDEIEEVDYEDGESAITWFYYDLQIDLNFESEDDLRLSFISVENEKYSLGGKIKVGMDKASVLAACKALNLSEPEIEDFSSEDVPDQELIGLEKENLNLWFTDGKLDEIQFGPFWKDDETPIWPN